MGYAISLSRETCGSRLRRCVLTTSSTNDTKVENKWVRGAGLDPVWIRQPGQIREPIHQVSANASNEECDRVLHFLEFLAGLVRALTEVDPDDDGVGVMVVVAVPFVRPKHVLVHHLGAFVLLLVPILPRRWAIREPTWACITRRRFVHCSWERSKGRYSG